MISYWIARRVWLLWALAALHVSCSCRSAPIAPANGDAGISVRAMDSAWPESPDRVARLRVEIVNGILDVFPREYCLCADSIEVSVRGEGTLDIVGMLQTLRECGNLTRLRLEHVREGPWVAEIDGHRMLEELHLHFNGLRALPESIQQLRSLTHLAVVFNELTELPDWIGQMASLRVLELRGCRLQELPTTLRELRLEALDLSLNPIGDRGAVSLRTQPGLKTLAMSGCGLSHWPDAIWLMRSIEYLALSANPIGSIDPRIRTLVKLEVLQLDSAGVTQVSEHCVFPPLLRSLQLSENGIKSISPASMSCARLRWLFLDGNPLLPEHVDSLRSGNPEIVVSWSPSRLR